MGTRILHDVDEGKAALYDSVSDHAFGPLFSDAGHMDAESAAKCFLAWFEVEEHKGHDSRHAMDVRQLQDNELEFLVAEWYTKEAKVNDEEDCALCDTTGGQRVFTGASTTRNPSVS